MFAGAFLSGPEKEVGSCLMKCILVQNSLKVLFPVLLLSIHSQVRYLERHASYHNRYPPQRFSRTIETTSNMGRVLLNRQLYRNPPYIPDTILYYVRVIQLDYKECPSICSKAKRKEEGTG